MRSTKIPCLDVGWVGGRLVDFFRQLATRRLVAISCCVFWEGIAREESEGEVAGGGGAGWSSG
eukprot:COSAG02_NODE_8377_length_2592_cov_4.426394_1_plen_63_part_00